MRLLCPPPIVKNGPLDFLQQIDLSWANPGKWPHWCNCYLNAAAQFSKPGVVNLCVLCAANGRLLLGSLPCCFLLNQPLGHHQGLLHTCRRVQ